MERRFTHYRARGARKTACHMVEVLSATHHRSEVSCPLCLLEIS